MLLGYHFRILANIGPTPHPVPAHPSGQTSGPLVDIGQTSGLNAPLHLLESVRGQISLPIRRALGVTFSPGDSDADQVI